MEVNFHGQEVCYKLVNKFSFILHLCFNLGPDLLEPCDDGSLVSSPNGEWIALLGCRQNPSKIYKLEGGAWTVYQKELKYPKRSGLAFLISDDLVNCVET